MHPSGANPERQLLIVNRIAALLLPGLVAFANPAVQAANDDGFTLSGQVLQAPEEGQILLKRNHVLDHKKAVLQTIEISSEGYFAVHFDGEPGIFEVDFFRQRNVALALDKGQSVKINLSLEKEEEENKKIEVEVTGSPDTALLHAYERIRKESLERLMGPVRKELREAYQRGETDEEVLARLRSIEFENYGKHRAELLDFVDENMGQSVAVYATALRWDAEQNLDLQGDLARKFAQAHPGLEISRKLVKKVEGFRKVAMGAIAPDIDLPDSDGEMKALADFRGKYVLLDFWASWCPPCREENANYGRIYEKYRDRGFEIFAVSLDTKRVQWLKATDKDSVVWPNVSDLKAYNSPAANEYSLSSLPANFLLDPEGRILSKNLRGEALRLRIADLLAD